jgi:hypothetical protein
VKKKRLLAALLVVVAAGLFAASATTASATPSETSRCTTCHRGTSVGVTATLASTTGTTATYNVSAPTATAIAVFDGTTKLTTITGTSGQFTVAFGKTYTVFAVKGPTTSAGVGSTSVSPVAPTPAPDTVAPVTSSNALATYVGSASITLTAVDNAGGSGVAHTYYVLDSDPQAEGLSVSTSALGTHTLEFWSVDVAGNIETPHNTVTFEVTAPPVPTPDTIAPTTSSDAVATYVGSASVTLTAVDNAGGSGVDHTYYILDALPQAEGLSVSTSALGTHVLEFWSVDVAGNIETPHNTVSFEVTAAPVPPVVPGCTIDSMVAMRNHGHRVMRLTGTITPGQIGSHAYLYAQKPGSHRWTRVTMVTARALNGAGGATWKYSYTMNVRGTYHFQVRPVPVPVSTMHMTERD